MTKSFTSLTLAAMIGASVPLALGAGTSYAASVVTAPNGMTLYVFDKDKGGKPTCEGACATNWPPYLGKSGEKMTKGWKLVKRPDGSMQWAYDGRPAYFFSGDKQKGDMKGDGLNGVWHTIRG